MSSSPIPLLPGPWRTLTPGHAAGFVLRLGRLLAQPRTHAGLAPHQAIGDLRAMPLSFYPGWALIEGEASIAPGIVGTFDVLYGPGLMWVIDGESRVLNDLNAGRVPADLDRYVDGDAGTGPFVASPLAELDPAGSAPDYFRFYCACVWGDEGPFMPVESRHSPVLRGVDPQGAAWADELRPIVVRRDGADLLAEGLIAYGRSLYRARLRMHEGSVTMEDDAPVATDILPARRNDSPLRDLRSAGAPSEPAQHDPARR